MSPALDPRLAVSLGSRILAMQAVLDAYGHVSVRSPERPDRFFIARNLAPASVMPNDVIELDLDGNIVDAPEGTKLFLERFIHGEIFRQRSDVHAVVHSHALPVLPFTLVRGVKVRPICHMCGFLDGAPETFDIAEHAGPASDFLISSNELGRNLAEHLGQANVVLMRSHGFTAVGGDVPQAVYRAIYTMKNCEIELAARTLGEPVFLNAGEAAQCERTISPTTGRAWDLWVASLNKAEGGA
jgi:ribulose-5-phosphate 4-epimerase/fuculose-1-phosphate aldolase